MGLGNMFDRKENGQYVTKAMRRKARDAVNTNKVIHTPCLVCNSREEIEGHHELYSKPFDVLFLCNLHHRGVEGIHTLELGDKKPFDYYVAGLKILREIVTKRISKIREEATMSWQTFNNNPLRDF